MKEKEQLTPLQELDNTYRKVMALYHNVSYEINDLYQGRDMRKLLLIIEQVHSKLHQAMNTKETIKFSVSSEFMLEFCLSLEEFGGLGLNFISVQPYSDRLKDFLLSLSILILNFCNLCIEEGKEDKLIIYSQKNLLSVKRHYETIIENLNLNMPIADIALRTKRLLDQAEHLIHAIGFGDSLVSVSAHYMSELERIIDRKPIQQSRFNNKTARYVNRKPEKGGKIV